MMTIIKTLVRKMEVEVVWDEQTERKKKKETSSAFDDDHDDPRDDDHDDNSNDNMKIKFPLWFIFGASQNYNPHA